LGPRRRASWLWVGMPRVVWADISTFLVRVLLLSRACSELAVVITMLA
jgi:hypothetical protein